MTWLLAAHALVGAAVLVGAPRLGRGAFRLGALPMLGMLAYIGVRSGRVLDGAAVDESTAWVGRLGLGIDLRLDGFALVMVLVVSGIGVAVMAYSATYFPSTPHAARIAGLLVLFSGSMLGLVLADHLLLIYTCWELTSITSWLLIGSNHTEPSARAGALHALLVTGAGGLVLLVGLVVVGQAAGTYSLSSTLADPPTGGAVGIGLGCILVGVVTKSAQFPTHAWLPGAMVAPTPVSAYLHSATMVKAGIYLAARFAPAFAPTGAWRVVVTTVGLVTMIHGGLRALRQNDLKLLLAMGTISQLGFMLVLVGAGRPEATVAGVVLLLAHALFKSALFLVVGIVDHQAGTRDRRLLAGFGPGWGPVKAVTLVSAASMAGLPPLVGFVAKEAAFEAFVHGGPGGIVTLAGLVAGSVLTFAYSARFAATILRPARGPGVAREVPVPERAGRAGPPGHASPDPSVAGTGHQQRGQGPRAPAPSVAFVAPAAVLAALTFVAGAGVRVLDPVIDSAARALDAGVDPVHLALWHGLTLPLGLTLTTVVLGGVLVVLRDPVGRLQAALAPGVGGDDAFAAAIRWLNLSARRLTGVVQNGSLPVYIAVILLTAVALPGAAVLAQATWPGWPQFSETPFEVVAAVLVIGAAIGAATVARRFAAVLLLGGVGYGVAIIFVVLGAPDLALTQFGIETLSLAVFALVLRHLPGRFERRTPAIATWLRVGVAAAVALAVFSFALVAAGSRDRDTVARGLIDRSLPEAGGRNVVNVVLVDFRGLDTLGEISVLAAAGLGVVALARVGRRTGRPGAPPGTASPAPLARDADPGAAHAVPSPRSTDEEGT